ncbi:MAG TPA: lytic transglycosylase domain-containing protein [Candidatus Angelobacter sp.]|nr:lytic transglycosylase domain-containing protein [Candidatus Angelobacter sp.]
MIRSWLLALFLVAASELPGQSKKTNRTDRDQAEYYAAAYGRHYGVPIALVRAIIEQESNWRVCVVSSKGAKGLMQLMPETARRLGVRDSCNAEQNISGGVRYLAWLMRLFHSDLRLVAAGYYAGEDIVARRGLSYRNPDVVAYVSRIRATYVRFTRIDKDFKQTNWKRDMR